MMLHAVVDRTYTDAELDAAIAAISEPQRCGRPRAGHEGRAGAPARARTGARGGGWFDLGHAQAVAEAAGQEDPGERLREVETLLAEETRLGMLVGVAVGFQLARELGLEPGDMNETQQEDR